MSVRPHRARAIIARFLAEDPEEPSGSWTADLGRLWRDYLRPHRAKLIALGILMSVWSFMPFGFALTWRYLIDGALLPEGGAVPYAERLRVWWVFFLTNLLGIWTPWLILYGIHSWLTQTVGRDLVFALRRALNDKLQDLHIGFFQRHPVGRLMSRVMDDVGVIQGSIVHVANIVGSFAKITWGFLVLGGISPRLMLLVAASLPFYAYAFHRLRPRIRRANIALRRMNSRMYGATTEKLAGVRVVKAFAGEKAEVLAFARLLHDSMRVQLRQVLYGQGLALIAAAIAAIATGAVIVLGAHEVRDGRLTLGGVIAFYSALGSVFEPVSTLTHVFVQLQAVSVVLRRVFGLLDEPVAVEPGRIQLGGMVGRIELANVGFRYAEQADPALRDVSLRIRPGEKVAVMGPSGAGKTTLLHLLLRFYDPTEGAIRVGGVDLSEADPKSLRRHVRLVPQEPVIFSGTLAESIAYGRLDATPEGIAEAAKAAEIHDFIVSLPEGYRTEVGERGVTLSGGQRQRLALATALLTEPEVLLLDDTTSALDAETEARIRVTLNRVLKGRTSLIVTQRIATARDCDRIIVLEAGRLTQSGTHEELRQEDGFYRRICERQEAV